MTFKIKEFRYIGNKTNGYVCCNPNVMPFCDNEDMLGWYRDSTGTFICERCAPSVFNSIYPNKKMCMVNRI